MNGHSFTLTTGCARTLAAVALISSTTTLAQADDVWERSPYRVGVFVDLTDTDLDEAQRMRVVDELSQRVDVRLRPFWNARVVLAESETPPEDSVRSENDKTIRLAARSGAGGVRIEASEHDETLGVSGPVTTLTGVALSDLSERLLAAAIGVFRPVAQFARDPEDRSRVTLSYRGVEIAPTVRLATAEAGELLVPYLLRRNRGGELVEGGAAAAPWTYLVAEPPEGAGSPSGAGVLSHTRRPFSVARRGRVERFALVSPSVPGRPATLLLHALDDPDAPLPGYEVLWGEVGSTDLRRLGYSDEAGAVALPEAEGVVMVHVRCGALVVASLPVAPGVAEEFVVPLIDERSRLRADVELTSLRELLIDTVARRKILAARLRRLIEAERLDAADELLTELDDLPGRTYFVRELDKAERAFKADHPIAQQRLDALFKKTRAILGGALDEREVRDLAIAVDRAKQAAELREEAGGGATPAT